MSEPPVTVLHRDDHLLVVSKPSGIPTTAPGSKESLVRKVQFLDPKAPRLHPTSRLDAEASGIVTFARTAEANQRLLKARRSGDYYRRYWALSGGVPVPVQGRWESVLAIDPRDPRRRIDVAEVGSLPKALRPRAARSRYALRARADGVSLLDVWPETGRTHQIRVQAAAAGCALLGDIHYGGLRRLVRSDGSVLRAARVMLHCAEIRIPDVVAGGHLTILSEPPADMQRLWQSAGGQPQVWKARMRTDGES